MRLGAWLFCLLGASGFGCLALSDGANPWPCQTNQDCLHGSVCIANACRPTDYCEGDFDCGSSFKACQDSRCVAVECSPQEDQTCLPYWCIGHECTHSCETRQDCHGGYSCRGGACVPTECNFGGLECEPYACVEQLCPSACLADADCLDGYACAAGACLAKPCAGDCPPCTTPACIAARCAGLECGMHDGADCGACPGAQYCSANQCEQACLERDCGLDHGVDCGACEGKHWCDPEGKCAQACVGQECGQSHGIECGPCGAKQYCDGLFNQCVTVCQGHDCGSEHGVTCGSCENEEYCDANQQCQPTCGPNSCGSPHGKACGGCPEKFLCSSYQCVPACENAECGAPFSVDCGPCPDDELCADFKCHEQVCSPDLPSFCKGDQLYSCDRGVAEAFVMDCSPDDYCYEDHGDFAPGAYCTAKCSNVGEKFCVLNGTYATCGDDGHPAPGGRDCPAEDLTCSNLGCGDFSNEWPLGTCTKTTTQRALGNVYRATKDTMLLWFGQHVKGDGVRFFVYESSAADGPYTLLAEKFYDYVQNDLNSTNYPLDLNAPIQAGHFYIVGLELKSNGTFCYEDSSATPQPLSFGELLPVGFATTSALPAQINTPSGPGNTEQNLGSIVLK